MKQHFTRAFAGTAALWSLCAPGPANAASVVQVDRGTWGASGVPDYVSMYIYVPDVPAANPPIIAAHHSCGTPVDGYKNSITKILSTADANGFIVILPEATGRNCWDVGSSQALVHDGANDVHAVLQMIRYVLSEYNGDASRVYAMGGSSGAMMTQALLAVYPEVFRAGSARAGVAAGCWADGFDAGQQWSNNCAGGNTHKTPEEWGNLVRAINPGYAGPRPRVQIFHGANDTTIAYANYAESIKQWTNVLELSETPSSSSELTTSVATYDQQFWLDECGATAFEAWSGRGGTHSMAYEEDAILAFFGLQEPDSVDPGIDCSGGGDDPPDGNEPADAGAGSNGGAGGTGGAGTGVPSAPTATGEPPADVPGMNGSGGAGMMPGVGMPAPVPSEAVTPPIAPVPTASQSAQPNPTLAPTPTTPVASEAPTASGSAPGVTSPTNGTATPGAVADPLAAPGPEPAASSSDASASSCAMSSSGAPRSSLVASLLGLFLFSLRRRRAAR
jgi:acetylxylan esterase